MQLWNDIYQKFSLAMTIDTQKLSLIQTVWRRRGRLLLLRGELPSLFQTGPALAVRMAIVNPLTSIERGGIFRAGW